MPIAHLRFVVGALSGMTCMSLGAASPFLAVILADAAMQNADRTSTIDRRTTPSARRAPAAIKTQIEF